MKNKKLLLTVLASFSMLLGACGEEPEPSGEQPSAEHTKHTWGDWNVVKEATCAEEGSKERQCTGCTEKDTQKINKKSHAYADYAGDATHVPVAANCGQEGVKFQKCSGCGDIKEVKLGKTGHQYGTLADQAAYSGANTATKIGTCSTCGEQRIEWSIQNYDREISSSGLGDGANGIKFKNVWNASKPEGGADAGRAGDYIGFSIYSPVDAVNAVFSFNVTTNSNTAPIFDSVANDNNPSYEWNGTEWVLATKRLKLIVNNEELEFGDDDYGDVAGSTQGWFDFPCQVNLKKGLNTIVLQCFGGYRQTMFDYALNFTPHTEHTWKAETAPAQGANDVALKKFSCEECGLVKYEVSAVDEKKVLSGSIKSGTKEGYMKLGSTGNSATYSFTLPEGEGFGGQIYQRGFIDSYKSNTEDTYSSGVTAPATNFEFAVNGTKIDVDEVARTTKYSEFFGQHNIDVDGADSDVAECLIGSANFVEGANTITYTRKGSFNLIISDFVIYATGNVCEHTFGEEPVAAKSVAATCETNGKNYFECTKCGEGKEVIVSALNHDMQDAQPDATHALREATCALAGISGWKKCSRCDRWEEVNTPKADHTFAGDVCSACGAIKVVIGDAAIWSSNKQVKSSSADFTITVANAGKYSLSMALKCGSGGSSQVLSHRDFSFKVNDGEAVAPTNNAKKASELGFSEASFNFGELTVLDLPAGTVKITIAFGANANYRFSIEGAESFMVLTPVAA